MEAAQNAALERIRRELRDILDRGQKITERDLLRLSALTGLDDGTVRRIARELS